MELISKNGSVVAYISQNGVKFPDDSPLRNMYPSVDVPAYASQDFDGRRIIPQNDPQFPEAFRIEINRRLKQQGYSLKKNKEDSFCD